MLPPLLIAAFSMSSARPGVVPVLPRSPGPRFTQDAEDAQAGIPLFRFRVPLRVVTAPIRQIPGVGAVRYPSDRRQEGTMGQVRVSFVVDADGRVDPSTANLINARQREFTNAVMDAMPAFRFRPLAVSGCAVRAIAEQSFNFYAAK